MNAKDALKHQLESYLKSPEDLGIPKLKLSLQSAQTAQIRVYDELIRDYGYKYGTPINRIPINAAAYRGHTEIVECMLNCVTPDQRYDLLNTTHRQTLLLTRCSPPPTPTQCVMDAAVHGGHTETYCTVIHIAATGGHTETVKCVLGYLTPEQRYDLLKIALPQSAMHGAAVKCYSECVKCMLDCIKPDQRYDVLKAKCGGFIDFRLFKATAVHWAITAGDTETVKCMLGYLTPDQICGILTVDSELDFAVSIEAAAGHSEMVRYILLECLTQDQKYDETEIRTEYMSLCKSVTSNAAATGNNETVLCILNDVIPDQRCRMMTDRFYSTAINNAAASGHTDSITCIMGCLTPDQRCDVTNSEFPNAICRAANGGHFETVKYIFGYLKQGQRHDGTEITEKFRTTCQTVVSIAATKGHKEIMQHILNYLTQDQRFVMMQSSDIHTAVVNGHTETVKCMLDSLNTEQKYEILELGISHTHFEVVRRAVEADHTEMVQCMLGSLTPDQRFVMLKTTQWETGDGYADRQRLSPIFWAAVESRAEIVKCMLYAITQEQRFHILSIPDSYYPTVILRAIIEEDVDKAIVKCMLDSVSPEQQRSLLSQVPKRMLVNDSKLRNRIHAYTTRANKRQDMDGRINDLETPVGGEQPADNQPLTTMIAVQENRNPPPPQ